MRSAAKRQRRKLLTQIIAIADAKLLDCVCRGTIFPGRTDLLALGGGAVFNNVGTHINKNADLFDIFFTLGNGTEKMPKQNYKLTLEKRKGEIVKQVCYVNEDGKLEKLEFTQDDKNV